MSKTPENPLESLHRSIVHDSMDWAQGERHAWIYGIIVGWEDESGAPVDEENDAMKELAETFKWNPETVDRLRRLRRRYLELQAYGELLQGMASDSDLREAHLRFTILPLQWKKDFREHCQEWTASVPMGTYTVQRTRENGDVELPWEDWRFEYRFAEYYDDHSQVCDNAANGKKLAWEDWLRRITPALAPALDGAQKRR